MILPIVIDGDDPYNALCGLIPGKEHLHPGFTGDASPGVGEGRRAEPVVVLGV
jgi:hypothetical protein